MSTQEWFLVAFIAVSFLVGLGLILLMPLAVFGALPWIVSTKRDDE